MTPEVHAAADRFIYATANTLHILSLLDDAALERRAPGSAWTTRQQLAHLCEAAQREADSLQRVLAGGPLVPEGWDEEAANARAAAAAATLSRDAIDDLLVAGLHAMLGALAAIPEDGPRAEGWSLGELAVGWSLHYEHHALDLVEAEPALATDPMVANWLLAAEFDDPALRKRHDRFRREAERAAKQARKKR